MYIYTYIFWCSNNNTNKYIGDLVPKNKELSKLSFCAIPIFQCNWLKLTLLLNLTSKLIN